jgi:integrase
MPRQAKLRVKNGHYYTAAGRGRYFGRKGEVDYGDAKADFANYLKELSEDRRADRRGEVPVEELIENFLDAVEAKRSGRTYGERKLHLERFGKYRRGGEQIREIAATTIEAADLERFMTWAKKEFTLDDFTVHKHMVSVVACFNWGAGVGKLKNNSPCLPASFRPFMNVERYKEPAKPLLESELPTDDEVKRLMERADDDVEQVIENGKYRSRRDKERRSGYDNPYRGFRDMLTVYKLTGARTSELAAARVGHFVRGAGQIVLAQNKRSTTMREPAARRIMLNDEAMAIVSKLCEGRASDNPIFTANKGRAWTRLTLGHRFLKLRKRAKVRKDITIYSFRHRWISMALMAGVDVATVAKMAGTSIAMVEKTYGHFSTDHFRDALKRMADKAA